MAKRISKAPRWRAEINHLADVSDDALGAARRLQYQAEENSETQSALRSLVTQLEEIRHTANMIRWITFGAPLEKLLTGKVMSKAEYFLVRADGYHLFTAKKLGLSPVDDYEVHRNLCYVDNERFCYIDPAAKPRNPKSKKVPSRIGVPPEELNFRDLRPEQKSFFEQYMPDVLPRFKAD